MLLLADCKDTQKQSVFMNIWLGGQKLGINRFDDEKESEVLQVSIYMYTTKVESRPLCDVGVRWTPSRSEILSVPAETFYFYNQDKMAM